MQTAYIDIHCHILYGVDDGSKDIETSLEMLRMSQDAGAQALILTPHYCHGRNSYAKGELEERFLRLKEAARDAGISAGLYLGNEILAFDGCAGSLAKGEALTLAGSRYALVEFYPDSAGAAIMRTARELIQAGYIPVIAHYERYRALREAKGQELIEELMRQGAYLQMNFGSLEGRSLGLFTDSSARWCREEVKKGHVSFFGTDAHGTEYRTPGHEAASAWLSRQLNDEELAALLLDNPMSVIADEAI